LAYIAFLDTLDILDYSLYKLGQCDLISTNWGHKGQKHIFNFFSENTLQISFKFSMEVHLGGLYQVCTK
jgi:hypothetical protein